MTGLTLSTSYDALVAAEVLFPAASLNAPAANDIWLSMPLVAVAATKVAV